MATTTSKELGQWGEFYASEPWGTEALDYLFANLCTVICSVMGTGKQKFKIEDFLVFSKPERKQESVSDMRRKCLMITRAMGGKVTIIDG